MQAKLKHPLQCLRGQSLSANHKLTLKINKNRRQRLRERRKAARLAKRLQLLRLWEPNSMHNPPAMFFGDGSGGASRGYPQMSSFVSRSAQSCMPLADARCLIRPTPDHLLKLVSKCG